MVCRSMKKLSDARREIRDGLRTYAIFCFQFTVRIDLRQRSKQPGETARLHPSVVNVIHGDVDFDKTVVTSFNIVELLSSGEYKLQPYMNLSHYESLDPNVHRSDRQKCLKACGNALPSHHQAPILLLEPGECPLGLEPRHHVFDGSPALFLGLPGPLGELRSYTTLA